MKSKILLLLVFTALMLNLHGQGKNFKRIFIEAEYYLLEDDYASALPLYENLLSTDPDNANLNFLCGYCSMKLGGDVNKIITLFEKAVQSANPSYKDGSYKERNAPMDSYFLLGRVFHINNQFDHAITAYTQYSSGIDKKNLAEINYVHAHIKACELGKSMINNPIVADIQPLGSNIEFDWDIYNPVVSGNDSILIFLTDRNDRITLMMSEKKGNSWSKPLVINPHIALTGNINPVSLSYDGTELYIVNNDYFNSDIYVSHPDGSRWSRAVKLNKNINTKYTESHASISREGTTLFFTSDRKGGVGGQDIYRAERISGDEWGVAVNLGNSVNTYYNEESPFITNQDQRLYFSSQGHNTMGGYDIFYCNKNSAGSWDVPKNIGYPVNSSDDDLFFNPGWDDDHAFYAIKSDNPDGNINIFNVRIPYIAELYAEESTPYNELQQVEATSDTPQPDETEKPRVTFSSLGIYYILNNILFDYNDYSINEEVMRDVERIYVLMNKYPEIGVELTGHTDDRGSNEYNIGLSTKRAKSVAGYLTSKGIDSDRISIKAVGESDPVAINQYEDGSDAKEGRKLNRHVSIKITNLSNNKIRVADIFVPDELIPKEDKDYSVLLLQSEERENNTPKEFPNEQVSMATESFDQGTYTIQIMALKKPRDVSYFDNISLLRRFDCKDGLYRFVTGEYDSIEDALKELPGVRRKGYRNAFIMSTSRYAVMSIGK